MTRSGASDEGRPQNRRLYHRTGRGPGPRLHVLRGAGADQSAWLAATKSFKRYAVRHLERLPLGTSYEDVCAQMVELFARPPLTNSKLIVDQTAVGKPMMTLLRRWRPIWPPTITQGLKAQPTEGGGRSVPKTELVTTMQILLQSKRIKIAQDLPQAATLIQELTNFKARTPAQATDDLLDWREGQQDDLVLSVATAAWAGERLRELWFY
jgi:hypothetical protein